jgi:glycine hydroxymethyltransferase
MLDAVHITVNKNTIPFETTSPFITSGIRIGTPAVTSRGMTEADCELIADLITRVIREKESCFAAVSAEVAALCARYPVYANDIL